MAELRRIVPDTGVIVAAFFETLVGASFFDVTPRARSLLQQIRIRAVISFAPDQLISEVMKVCFEKCGGRNRHRVPNLTSYDAAAFVNDFLELPISFVCARELHHTALDLVLLNDVPPPDSWFVACAIQNEAELWLTHECRDGLLGNARNAHNSVHALAARGKSRFCS
jgi:hypothetical protein